jgi:serine/threonine protein kinase
MPPAPDRTPDIKKPQSIAEEGTVLPAAPGQQTTPSSVNSPRVGALPTQLPATFGRYQLLKLLGQGGMGAVYLARDTQLEREVALKIPLFATSDGPQLMARFQREARAAATVVHPNVCPLHEVGEIDGTPYLTMAFIDGKPLSAFIRAKPPTPRQSAVLVCKLAVALQEAHRRGVIHRDLKPANIMIDRRGEPVIMDFGLARRTGAGDARLTQQGDLMGTPAYMSPEQVSGDVNLMGPLTDVYSLGVILYELLAGRLPFDGDPMAVLARVLMDNPEPPSKFQPDLDPVLEAICLKCLAKKPEGRHASMAVMAAALQNYLKSGDAVAEQPEQAAPRPTEDKPPSRVVKSQPKNDTGAWLSVAQAYQGQRPRLAAKQPAGKRPAEPAGQSPPRRQDRILWPWIAGAIAVMGLLPAIIILLMPSKSPSPPPVATESIAPARPIAMPLPAPLVVPLPPEVAAKPGLAAGFSPLFNGRDFSGWEKSEPAAHVWHVQSEEMVFDRSDTRGPEEWLLTERDYINFTLRLEFQLSREAKSGVAVRVGPGAVKPLFIPLQDDKSPDLATLRPNERTGALAGLAGQATELRPGDVWNELQIELRGWSLRVAVNGKETTRVMLNSNEVFRYLDGAPNGSGRIGIRYGRGQGRFRALQINDGSIPSESPAGSKIP